MEITLEKIELVKDRTGVSYKEAKEMLEEADGSVVDAIIAIEEGINENSSMKIGASSSTLVDKIKETVKKGNASRIKVRKDDELIVNVPVNVGIAGAIITPIAMTAAAIAAMGFRCNVEVEKEDGSVVEISERLSETKDSVIEKGAVLFDGVKTKGSDYVDSIKEKKFDEKFEGIVDKAKDVSDAVIDRAKESSLDDVYENVKEKYHDIADAAKSKFESVKSDDDFSLNISEDFENVAEAMEEEIAEELGGIKIVNLTDKE